MNLSPPGAQPASKSQFMLRFPDGEIRKELKVRAAKNERSLNSEILYLIKRGLSVEQQPQGARQ